VTASTPIEPVVPAPRYEPYVEVHRVFAAECPCGWSGEIRNDEADANTDADNHLTQHLNEVIWPEGTKVRWARSTKNNTEWWHGTVVRHAGTNAVINVAGYRDYKIVSAKDLRKL
jgi:hypothetical protein